MSEDWRRDDAAIGRLSNVFYVLAMPPKIAAVEHLIAWVGHQRHSKQAEMWMVNRLADEIKPDAQWTDILNGLKVGIVFPFSVPRISVSLDRELSISKIAEDIARVLYEYPHH